MIIRERIRDFGIGVLEFAGSADTTSMTDIQDSIRKAGAKHPRIICDLQQVTHINSAGLNAFLLAAKSIITANGEIIFCCIRPEVERVFMLGRLDKYLKFFPTLNEAEVYFRTRGDVDTSARENLLIVEKKNLMIRKHLSDILEQGPSLIPFDMYSAKAVDQALRYLKSKKFSLVLLDATFSLGEGKDLIDNILSNDFQTLVPILVVTTKDTQENAHYFIRSGAHDIIQFPYNPIEVQSRLNFMITAGKNCQVS